jgi:hypothetical protein
MAKIARNHTPPRIAVPPQFHLALFLKQQKAMLLRQRLIRLNKPNNLLLFVFRQSRHECPLFINPSTPNPASFAPMFLGL